MISVGADMHCLHRIPPNYFISIAFAAGEKLVPSNINIAALSAPFAFAKLKSHRAKPLYRVISGVHTPVTLPPLSGEYLAVKIASRYVNLRAV